MAMEYAAALPGMRKGAAIPSGTAGGCLPLSMARAGETVYIRKLRGNDGVIRFLRNLGFVEEAPATVVSELSGNVIVQVKGTRVAISKAMAGRILTGAQKEE